MIRFFHSTLRYTRCTVLPLKSWKYKFRGPLSDCHYTVWNHSLKVNDNKMSLSYITHTLPAQESGIIGTKKDDKPQRYSWILKHKNVIQTHVLCYLNSFLIRMLLHSFPFILLCRFLYKNTRCRNEWINVSCKNGPLLAFPIYSPTFISFQTFLFISVSFLFFF